MTMEPSEEHTQDGKSTSELIHEHLPLARRLASRYAGKGEPLDDLIQVARLGLVNAAQRFDPDRGLEFTKFAVPTILGELRRHFRDSCWAVRVPRGLQELATRVQTTADELSREQGRSPTVREVASRLEISEDEVLEAIEAGSAYSAASLDAPAAKDDPTGPTLGDRLGSEESMIDLVEAKEAAREALSHLPERERRVLTLRYFGDRTQREIAEELHISQMHVSRLLARTLTLLRDHLVDEVELPDSWHDRKPSGLCSTNARTREPHHA
jgi:RNA polymerase sigma-B factor